MITVVQKVHSRIKWYSSLSELGYKQFLSFWGVAVGLAHHQSICALFWGVNVGLVHHQSICVIFWGVTVGLVHHQSICAIYWGAAVGVVHHQSICAIFVHTLSICLNYFEILG